MEDQDPSDTPQEDKTTHGSKHRSRTPLRFPYHNQINTPSPIMKNIPSYISCILSTTVTLLMSSIFCIQNVMYRNLDISSAIIYILAVTTICFIGSFKIII
jgi:hypothetical protein